MENASLTLADMASLKNLIEAATARGAFRANEVKQVGELHEKLTKFLEAVVEQAKAQQEADEQSQGETK